MAGEPPWRCYVAVVPSPDALARIEAGLAPLQAAFPQAHWTALDDIHLTLIFMATVPAEGVPAVVAAVAAVAADMGSFGITVQGAGEFGGRGRPSVSWLGIGDGRGPVLALESALRGRLAAIPGLEGLADDALSMPHLTVARRAPAGVAQGLAKAFDGAGPAWSVDRVVLYRSELGRRGARHTPILSAPLSPGLRAAAGGG